MRSSEADVACFVGDEIAVPWNEQKFCQERKKKSKINCKDF